MARLRRPTADRDSTPAISATAPKINVGRAIPANGPVSPSDRNPARATANPPGTRYASPRIRAIEANVAAMLFTRPTVTSSPLPSPISRPEPAASRTAVGTPSSRCRRSQDDPGERRHAPDGQVHLAAHHQERCRHGHDARQRHFVQQVSMLSTEKKPARAKENTTNARHADNGQHRPCQHRPPIEPVRRLSSTESIGEREASVSDPSWTARNSALSGLHGNRGTRNAVPRDQQVPGTGWKVH